MTKNRRAYRKQSDRRISIRGERRDPPDTHRLSHALLAQAMELAQSKTDSLPPPVSSSDPVAFSESSEARDGAE